MAAPTATTTSEMSQRRARKVRRGELAEVWPIPSLWRVPVRLPVVASVLRLHSDRQAFARGDHGGAEATAVREDLVGGLHGGDGGIPRR